MVGSCLTVYYSVRIMNYLFYLSQLLPLNPFWQPVQICIVNDVLAQTPQVTTHKYIFFTEKGDKSCGPLPPAVLAGSLKSKDTMRNTNYGHTGEHTNTVSKEPHSSSRCSWLGQGTDYLCSLYISYSLCICTQNSSQGLEPRQGPIL